MHNNNYAIICNYMQHSLRHRNMQKYANYMHAICKNRQNMQSRFAYAKYAKISTPTLLMGPEVRVRAVPVKYFWHWFHFHLFSAGPLATRRVECS